MMIKFLKKIQMEAIDSLRILKICLELSILSSLALDKLLEDLLEILQLLMGLIIDQILEISNRLAEKIKRSLFIDL